MSRLPLVLLGCLLLPAYAALGQGITRDDCPGIEAPDTFQIEGRSLKLLPDIATAELRLAYVLLDARCLERGAEVFGQQEAAHAGSAPHGNSLQVVNALARSWSSDVSYLEPFLTPMLDSAPGFAPPAVMLARIEFSRGNTDRGRELLDRALALQPDDLHANVTDTAVGYRVVPSAKKRAFLEAVLAHPHVPLGSRREAGQALLTGDAAQDDAVVKQIEALPRSVVPGAFGH